MKIALVYMDMALNKPGLSLRHVNSDPLGIRYLASNLIKKVGYDVKVYLQGTSSVDEIAESIISWGAEFVGFSCLTFNVPVSQQLASIIKSKNKNVKIVFGGEHPSLSPETTFTGDIDFIVKGEGERTIVDLIETVNNRGDIKDVGRIFYIKDGNIQYTYDRDTLDINSLEWPLRDYKIVASTRMNSFVYPSPDNQTGLATMLTSRGCSFSCIYCTSQELWGQKTRFRDIDNINDEIDHIVNHSEANVIAFYDLTFNVNSNFVIRLCDSFIERGWHKKISFYSTCRISAPNGKLMLTRDLLKKMKTAGFNKIGVGLESTSDDIAGQYKAGKSPWENNVQAINDAHELGILVRIFLIIGGPNENRLTYEETKRRLNEIPAHDLRVSYLTPFPGTVLNSEIPPEKRFTMSLSEYNCSNPIIINQTFSYKELSEMERDLLHTFHTSPYRESVIADIVKIDPRFKESAEWRKRDLEQKGLLHLVHSVV